MNPYTLEDAKQRIKDWVNKKNKSNLFASLKPNIKQLIETKETPITIVKKSFSDAFSYSHCLPEYPDPGKCRELHGHNATLEVCISGKLSMGQDDKMGLILWPCSPENKSAIPIHNSHTDCVSVYPGMVVDFGDLKKFVKSVVIDKLDHTHLNDSLPKFVRETHSFLSSFDCAPFGSNWCYWDNLKFLESYPPTCEVLANIIYYTLCLYFGVIDDLLGYTMELKLEKVVLSETNSSCVEVVGRL